MKTFWLLLILITGLVVEGSASAGDPGQTCESLFQSLSRRQQKNLARIESLGFLNARVVLQSERIELWPIEVIDVPFLHELNAVDDIRQGFGMRGTGKDALGGFLVDWANLRVSSTRHHFFGAWIIRVANNPVGYIHLRKQLVANMPDSVESAIEEFLRKNELPENSLILSAGYVISPGFRGSGIAGEALGLITHFAKSQLKAVLITPKTYPDNEASKRVLLKAGFIAVESQQRSDIHWFASDDINPRPR